MKFFTSLKFIAFFNTWNVIKRRDKGRGHSSPCHHFFSSIDPSTTVSRRGIARWFFREQRKDNRCLFLSTELRSRDRHLWKASGDDRRRSTPLWALQISTYSLDALPLRNFDLRGEKKRRREAERPVVVCFVLKPIYRCRVTYMARRCAPLFPRKHASLKIRRHTRFESCQLPMIWTIESKIPILISKGQSK